MIEIKEKAEQAISHTFILIFKHGIDIGIVRFPILIHIVS